MKDKFGNIFLAMKDKNGNMVEVSMKDKFGTFFGAVLELFLVNTLTYIVSYNVYPNFSNTPDVKQVRAESIRPMTTLMETSKSRELGDIVEVFHNFTWKMAIVLEDFEWEFYLVKLPGTVEEFEVTKFQLRARQSYENDEWIIVDKVSIDHEDANDVDNNIDATWKYYEDDDTDGISSSNGSCSSNNKFKSCNVKFYESDAESTCH